MRILFIGGTAGNSGPGNVNREYIRNLTETFCTLDKPEKLAGKMQGVMLCMRSSAVVISGVGRYNVLIAWLAKCLGKKVVYIMHGCAAYEVAINKQANMEKGISYESFLLKNADLLLPVSKKYMKWVKERYPQYADKTAYLYNGIGAIEHSGGNVIRKTGHLISTGADRIIKNNIIVADVVESLGGMLTYELCGKIYYTMPTHYNYTNFTDVIPHDDYLDRLREAELFVCNSLLESFSLSAIEALMCGCSVLLSEKAGITDILELEECDLIHDPMDRDEIRRKILYLLEHPNNQRIMERLDLDEYSYPRQVARLEAMCRELING